MELSQKDVIDFLVNARKKLMENAPDIELEGHYDSVIEDLRTFDY